MFKRGISNVVATVLLVLITVLAVTLLWLGLSSFLDIDYRNFDYRLSIITSTGYTFYDREHDLVTVQVESFGDATNGVDIQDKDSLDDNWDFNTIWEMDSDGYPHLQWEDEI